MKYLVHLIRIPFYVTMLLAFLGKFILELNLLIAIIAILMISINLMMYKEVEISYISKRAILFISITILFWLTYIIIGNEVNKLIILTDRVWYFKYGLVSIVNMIVFMLYSLYDKNLKKQILIIVLLVFTFLVSMFMYEVITELMKNGGKLPRIKGWDGNPNLSSTKLNILLFTIFSLMKDNKKYKIYFIFIDILVAICVIFTMSRGSIIVFSLIQLIVLYDFGKKNKKELIIALIVFIIGGLIVVNFMESFELKSDRLTRSGWGDGDFSNGRVNLVINGINAFIQNPLWGVGLGNSGVYGVMYGTAEDALMPHNTVVYIAAETGIIPITILLTAVSLLFFRTIKEENNNVARLIIILGAVNFFTHNVHLYPFVYMSLFTLLVFDEKNNLNKIN